MIIVTYDISNDKKRTKFAKYLEKFGNRIQYSVFRIENSDRILKVILADLNNRFIKKFDQEDSVYVFRLNPNCEVHRFGFAKNEEGDLLIVK